MPVCLCVYMYRCIYAYMFVDQCNQDIFEMFLKMLRTRVQKTSQRGDKQELLYWQKQSDVLRQTETDSTPAVSTEEKMEC